MPGASTTPGAISTFFVHRSWRGLRNPIRPSRSVTPPLAGVQGDTINLPMTKVARIVVRGLDDQEVQREITAQSFLSSDTSVCTVAYSRNTGVCIVTPVAPGTATVTIG